MDAKVEILKNATKRTLTINEGSPLHSAVMVAMDDYAKEKSTNFAEWFAVQDITSRGNKTYVDATGKIVTISDLYDLYLKL